MSRHPKNNINKGADLKVALQCAINETNQSNVQVAEKESIIQNLKDALQVKQQDIYKMNIEINKLRVELKQVYLECNEFKKKFCELEKSYDAKSDIFDIEIKKLKKALEEDEKLNKECEQKMNEEQERWQQQLANNNAFHVEALNKLQSELEQRNKDFEAYKETSKMEMHSIQDKANHDLINVRNELAHVQEELRQIIEAKLSMESNKDNIISEQAYKIREIERVFIQPTKCVQPSNDSTEQKKVNKHNIIKPLNRGAPLHKSFNEDSETEPKTLQTNSNTTRKRRRRADRTENLFLSPLRESSDDESVTFMWGPTFSGGNANKNRNNSSSSDDTLDTFEQVKRLKM